MEHEEVVVVRKVDWDAMEAELGRAFNQIRALRTERTRIVAILRTIRETYRAGPARASDEAFANGFALVVQAFGKALKEIGEG